MTVNPLQQVDDNRFDVPLDINLARGINRLAALEPALDAPYFTVCLDWRPDGQRPDLRPARRVFDDQKQELLESLEAHTPPFESLSADVERINDWLETVDDTTQGIVIVACSARNVFEPFALAIPVETELTTGPLPSLRPLIEVADDYGLYAVILADQQEARLELFQQGIARRQSTMIGSDWPRHQQQGGWSQRRYQNAAEQRVMNFAKEVGEEIRARLDAAGVNHVVVAAGEPMASALDSELPQTVRDRIVGHISLGMEATPSQVASATADVIEQVERQQEQDAIQMVQDHRGPGQRTAVGVSDVLAALQSGQVMTLIMNDDFQGDGWADFNLHVFGAGSPPRRHPAGGNVGDIVQVPLAEAMLRLALSQAADIEIVQSDVPADPVTPDDVPDATDPMPRAEAALALDEMGGVAALLRFAVSDDEATPTA